MPPELASAQVTVTRPVGGSHLDIVTASGVAVARHAASAHGLGMAVRDSGHVVALERLAIANTGKPHRRKERIPPRPDAPKAAKALRGRHVQSSFTSKSDAESSSTATSSDVVDLSTYERAARERNTLA
ncbi:hypothetical protein CH298_28035 [Rhodococcoides fascians]|nr:hypothetical protein CH263_07960 [Rhodococcus sp. 06-1059B-a]OZE81198.1 hypothetical protein CH303_27785 [Rhodococcus fascians]OZF08499.1 hypothetical protein CH298_28035 [Rhodococcus fascians]OZF12323.1 hypothetical protein CH297_27830 [Rhodococcus fascians]OZF59226.1 hypothetical protein CH308_27920 [Rhodococcus fascians]